MNLFNGRWAVLDPLDWLIDHEKLDLIFKCILNMQTQHYQHLVVHVFNSESFSFQISLCSSSPAVCLLQVGQRKNNVLLFISLYIPLIHWLPLLNKIFHKYVRKRISNRSNLLLSCDLVVSMSQNKFEYNNELQWIILTQDFDSKIIMLLKCRILLSNRASMLYFLCCIPKKIIIPLLCYVY